MRHASVLRDNWPRRTLLGNAVENSACLREDPYEAPRPHEDRYPGRGQYLSRGFINDAEAWAT